MSNPHSKMIRLAASTPKGSPERAVLAVVTATQNSGRVWEGSNPRPSVGQTCKTASLVDLRRKMDQMKEIQEGGIWFVVADQPPTSMNASFLGVPFAPSFSTFRDEGGLIYVSDAETAQRVNRSRDGIRGNTSVVWVTDVELLSTHMPDLFSHRSGLIRLANQTSK